MDKRKLTRIAALGALVIGLACLIYPFASDFIYKQAQRECSVAYQDAVQASSSQSLEKEWKEARRYNSDLLNFKAVVTDPFDPKLKKTTSRSYDSLLDVSGSGVMCTVKVPSVGIETPVFHGVGDEVLSKGAGHLEGTSLPVGGKSTHCVIAGHTGLSIVKVFDSLDKVQVGDLMVVEVLDEVHAYRVTSTQVVLPEKTDSLLIQEGQDLLTLVTCTPYGINTHRLLVHGKRCELPDDWETGTQQADGVSSFDPDNGVFLWALGGAAAGIAACVLAVFLYRRKAKPVHGSHAKGAAAEGADAEQAEDASAEGADAGRAGKEEGLPAAQDGESSHEA